MPCGHLRGGRRRWERGGAGPVAGQATTSRTRERARTRVASENARTDRVGCWRGAAYWRRFWPRYAARIVRVDADQTRRAEADLGMSIRGVPRLALPGYSGGSAANRRRQVLARATNAFTNAPGRCQSVVTEHAFELFGHRSMIVSLRQGCNFSRFHRNFGRLGGLGRKWRLGKSGASVCRRWPC
jgi:hypothetical protein